MDAAPLIDRILADEGLTSDLDEPAATLLLRELTARARTIAANASDLAVAVRATEAMCQSAREIAREVAEGRQAGEAQASELRRLLPRLAV